MPSVGDYNIILDKDKAICIIRTTKVYKTHFSQVSTDHAVKEGERDRSLKSWRDIHESFFSEELKKIGLKFTSEMLVVCEEFEVVYPIS